MTPQNESVSKERSELRVGATPEVARGFAEAALSKNATGLIILDLKNLTTLTDFFIVGTVSTDVHSRAVEGAIVDWARDELQLRPWHIEGAEGSRNWVLLDYIDVVVHLFQPETRDYYSLEKLWGDALMEEIKDPDE